MSFFREVINIVNENETVEARKHIIKLLAEIQNFQFKVKIFIDENYVDFLSNSTNNEIYLNEAHKLSEEIDAVLQNVCNETKNDLVDSSIELHQYIEQLNEISIELRTSNKILRIDDLFKQLEDAKSENEHNNIKDILSEIKCLMDDPKDLILRNLECFQSIKIKWFMEQELMLHNLKKHFEALVQFTEKTFQNTKSVTIKISHDENKLHEIIVALINSKYNPKRMCDFLFDNVFAPIITKPISMECDEKVIDNEFHQLSISYGLNELANNLKPNYKLIFQHLKTVFNCLGHMNITITNNLCVFKIFANNFKEKFLNTLISDCLIYSIPDTMDEMNASTMVKDVVELNEYLTNMLFLNETDMELINYAEKISILFKNRFCMNILDSSIEIMRKDLHDMMLVAELDLLTSSSTNPCAFPRCMISKSTMELIALIEKVLRQADTSTVPDFNESLMSTIPLILNRYLTEVPTYHEKLLLNIPQQTALYHNNCMYLAYWIAKNSINYENQSFLTLMKPLQQSGTEQFVIQIKNQHTQLMDILDNFDLKEAVSELGNESKKIIRQCLRQLDLLKNVWQTVLPEVVYNKTMGNILNDFCVEIIQRILAMEDISSIVANDLVQICDTIIERAPQTFQDPLQVSIIVKSWVKFQQLKTILNASLIQITELWSEGKGPLCLHYKADEIKHLMRSLFQNTDRRANALLTIV